MAFFDHHIIVKLLREEGLPLEDPHFDPHVPKSAPSSAPTDPDAAERARRHAGNVLASFDLDMADPLVRSERVDWLCQLPPPEKAEKIYSTFLAIAKKHGARMATFQWWSIGTKGQRYVRSLVHRADGKRVQVVLSWKKRRYATGERAHTASISRVEWGYDLFAPGGYRMDLEGDIYPHAAELFDAWLAQHLKKLPNGRPFPDPVTHTPAPGPEPIAAQ